MDSLQSEARGMEFVDLPAALIATQGSFASLSESGMCGCEALSIFTLECFKPLSGACKMGTKVPRSCYFRIKESTLA